MPRWFPVAPGITTLPAAPAIIDTAPTTIIGTIATVGATPQTALNAAFPAAVSGNGVQDLTDDHFWKYNGTTWVDVGPNPGPTMTVPAVLPVWQETVLLDARVRIGLEAQSFGFALQALTTVPAFGVKIGIAIGGAFARVSGIAAPVLGDGQVTPTTAATDDDWTLLYDDTDDEGSTASGSFGFDFTLDGVAYTSCFITSNQYLTFGTESVEYQNLDADMPAVPKLHMGSGDFSYQRIYTKAEAGLFRIRWEGNSSFSADAGDSNRFLEVTFYAPSGGQLLEVRTGDISGSTAGPFMLATDDTSLADGTLAANSSWVYEGNSDGTTWTLYEESHVE
jgi:hypothetical protein